MGISVILIICNIFGTIHPFVMKKILEVDIESRRVQMILIQLVALYVGIHVGYAFLKNVRNIQINKLMAKVVRDIRETLFDKVLTFKMRTFEKYNSAQLYTRLTDDINQLGTMFMGALNVVVNNVIYLIFMVIMMFFANISLAWIGLATICSIGLSTKKFTKLLGNYTQKWMKKRDEENKRFSEFFNRNKLTYLYQLQERNIKEVNYLLDKELQARKGYILLQSFTYWVLTLLEALGIYAVLYYALNMNVSISIGSIYLILFYSKECRGPLHEICNQLEEIQNCMVSYQRIAEVLKEKNLENLSSGKEVETVKGDIEFQNVWMKYEKETVLEDVSFLIKEGSKVPIAGRTGAGKSTLVNVLMKMYDIQSGKILIGNKDIHKIATKSLRNNISYISQNPYIFADTLRNNIRLGNQNITDEQIMNLVQEIGVNLLLEKLPQGLDTTIKANEMSYGELQIIAFIRAILHQANIYIFDEPTSNIDLKTENMIQKIIDHISKTSTVLIIAHRKSTIASSDKIIYLKNGKVDRIVNKEKNSELL